ncbi:MAG: Cys-tRNA(Pro) deacylase [Clostridia bacterium]|nr:Cys-tRNA(Pro) deacylase [Candidatus Pelethousia sp.]NCB31301.1 Cys-tRNA(Pro) deacylase [Clostridia bacterium]
MNTTNAMRLLTLAGIPYTPLAYDYDESDLSGVHAAAALGIDPDATFKTLVMRGEKTGLFVCCVPVAEEVDPKKAAKAMGDKKAEMLHVKELLGATGYIRGGCSPVGMKKQLPTLIDETAQLFDQISVSAGTRGQMLLLNPEALARYVGAEFVDLLKLA